MPTIEQRSKKVHNPEARSLGGQNECKHLHQQCGLSRIITGNDSHGFPITIKFKSSNSLLNLIPCVWATLSNRGSSVNNKTTNLIKLASSVSNRTLRGWCRKGDKSTYGVHHYHRKMSQNLIQKEVPFFQREPDLQKQTNLTHKNIPRKISQQY